MRKKSGKGTSSPSKRVKVSELQKELEEQKSMFEQKIVVLSSKLESNEGEKIPLPPAAQERNPLLPASGLNQRGSGANSHE